MLDVIVAVIMGLLCVPVFVNLVRLAPFDKKKHLLVSMAGVFVVSILASLFFGVVTGINIGFWFMFLV